LNSIHFESFFGHVHCPAGHPHDAPHTHPWSVPLFVSSCFEVLASPALGHLHCPAGHPHDAPHTHPWSVPCFAVESAVLGQSHLPSGHWHPFLAVVESVALGQVHFPSGHAQLGPQIHPWSVPCLEVESAALGQVHLPSGHAQLGPHTHPWSLVEVSIVVSFVVFAGGCFWGIQSFFKEIRGVIATRVGYTGGNIVNPSYRQICTGLTGHTEACIVHYDSSETNLVKLLEHFFSIIDPTLIDQQGPDVGSQYRTGIYYYNMKDRNIINDYIDSIRHNYEKEIVTEIKACEDFWEAEEYHQDYLEKNPEGHCHIEGIKFYKAIKRDYGLDSEVKICQMPSQYNDHNNFNKNKYKETINHDEKIYNINDRLESEERNDENQINDIELKDYSHDKQSNSHLEESLNKNKQIDFSEEKK